MNDYKKTGDMLDELLMELLSAQIDSEADFFQQSVSVSNLRGWYRENALFWPPLDAEQRVIFDRCTAFAKEIGIER